VVGQVGRSAAGRSNNGSSSGCSGGRWIWVPPWAEACSDQPSRPKLFNPFVAYCAAPKPPENRAACLDSPHPSSDIESVAPRARCPPRHWSTITSVAAGYRRFRILVSALLCNPVAVAILASSGPAVCETPTVLKTGIVTTCRSAMCLPRGFFVKRRGPRPRSIKDAGT